MQAAPAAPDKNGYCRQRQLLAQPIGGAFKVLGTAELYLPLPVPEGHQHRTRLLVRRRRQRLLRIYSSFNASTLRASTGLSLHWQAPIGPLIISFAVPFRTQSDDNHYEERIQFTFGSHVLTVFGKHR